MALWIVKLTETKGQYRLTIPKKIIQAMQLTDEKHVTLEDGEPDVLIIRRLIVNGEKATD